MLNAWKRRGELRQYWARNLVLGIMTFAIMYGAFAGTIWVLRQCETQLDFAYFHPSIILGLFFAVLCIVLLITNTASATGALFIGHDLEFILASPLSPRKFFFGKLLEILVSSSWMTAVFLVPISMAFAAHYRPGFSYALICLLAFIPFFVIPAGIAVVIATILAVLVPTKWRRELVVLFACIGLFGLFSLGRLVALGFDNGSPIDTRDLFRIIGLLSVANTTWSPAYWIAASLGEWLAPRGAPALWYMGLLYGFSVALLSLAFLAVRLLHFAGYSRAALHARSKYIESRTSQERMRRLLSKCAPAVRSLVVKELKTSSRDVVQSMQMVLICVLCVLYLYVLSFQGLFQRMIPEGQRGWWRVFLITCNLCMEAFVVTAIANRLVFPSVSREGRSFWTLQTAPISLRKFLMVKYFFWLVLVGIFTSIIFGGAALLLSRSGTVVVFKVLLNIANAVGVIGLAIGFGSYFANFDWDHPGQLITGFGNMVYTVVAVLLIGANLMLGTPLLFVAFTKGMQDILPNPARAFATLAGFAIIYTGNIAIARWALSVGTKALESRK